MAEPRYSEIIENLSDYAKQHVEPVLKDMLKELFLKTPEDPVQFMIDYLTSYKEKPEVNEYASDDNISLPDHLEALPIIETTEHHNRRPRGRRPAVSAEPVDSKDLGSVPTRVIKKSPEDRDHIRRAVSNNILFADLDEDELKVVIDAMEARHFADGETIIKQGADGDEFFITEQGECDCYLQINYGGEPKLVKTYTYGESFGELALMYSQPRAATIKARGNVKVWVMDRLTFRKVLMQTTSEKRARYDSFLAKVPLLASLDKYERSKVSDALIEVRFKDGECIIAQGDRGHNLYFIKHGAAVVMKALKGETEPREVMRYKEGDYFGELALVHDSLRAASVYADGDTVCVYLDRDAFNRLLGPCEEILKRNMDNYHKIEKRLAAESLRGDDSTIDDDPKVNYVRARRRNVFSETVSEMSKEEFTPVVIPKTEDQVQSIRTAIAKNFLFSSLEPEELNIVVDAMFERKFKAGDTIIKQGDKGDNFYVLHSGLCECFVQKGNAEPKMVKLYEHGESFGELALMYNAPRAASIIAKTDVVVFGVDRITFHRVIMDAANTKRKQYEAFLHNVPILASLDNYERGTIADALEPVSYAEGEYIIQEGETGDGYFYIVKSGTAKATKKLEPSDDNVVVYEYQPGGFFGELALLHDKPRAANVIAGTGGCRCVRLNRGAFVRLLGPIEDILHRNQDEYEKIEAQIKGSQ